LLLWSGRISKVRTCHVRLTIPFTAIPEPVRTSPIVMIAAPLVPPKNAVVPVTPTVVNAPATPSPITGARRPAESPITKSPTNYKQHIS